MKKQRTKPGLMLHREDGRHLCEIRIFLMFNRHTTLGEMAEWTQLPWVLLSQVADWRKVFRSSEQCRKANGLPVKRSCHLPTRSECADHWTMHNRHCW